MTAPIVAYIAWLSRTDWDRWRAVDESPQPRFHDWQKDAQAMEGELRRRGIDVRRVAVDPEEFLAWRRTANVEPNAKARASFAYAIGEKRDMH